MITEKLPEAFYADRSDWGRLTVTGSDRATFLHNLTTHDIVGLAPGQGLSAAIVNQRGGLIDRVAVYADVEQLRVITGPGRAEAVLAWLDRYLITEDVQLVDETAASTMWLLGGSAATEVLARLTGEPGPWPPFSRRMATVAGRPVEVLGTDDLSGPAYHLAASVEDAPTVLAALGAEAQMLAPASLEALRIREGLPAVGREIVEARNPWEARLDASLSLQKGCYLGQEVVARLNTYNKVQRYLVGLAWEGPPPEDFGEAAPLYDGDQRVGEVTSAVEADGGRVSALGYVKAAVASDARPLSVKLAGRDYPVAQEDRAFWQGKTRRPTPLG